jgi:hypothetical protein
VVSTFALLGAIGCGEAPLASNARPAPAAPPTRVEAEALRDRLAATPLPGRRSLGRDAQLVETSRASLRVIEREHAEAAPWRVAGVGRLERELPTRAGAPMRLTRAEDAAFWAEIVADDLPTQAPAARLDGSVAFPSVLPDLDVWIGADAGAIEELRVVRAPTRSADARYRLRVGPSVAEVRARDGRIELLDAQGYARIVGEAPWAVDGAGTTRAPSLSLERRGDERWVRLHLDVAGLRHPIVVDPAWRAAGGMKHGRTGAAALSIKDAAGHPRVLFVGGTDCAFGATSTTELYDPSTDTFSDGPSLADARERPTVTTLADGRVLVTGGFKAGGLATDALTSIELWRPGDAAFVRGAAMRTPRAGHTLTNLGGDFFLAVGTADATYGVERYNATKDGWESLSPAPTNRSSHTLTRLPNGKLLIVGGGDARGASTRLDTGYLLDPAANTWTPIAVAPTARVGHAAFLQPSGKVVVVGGAVGTQIDAYDPVAGAWSAIGALHVARIQEVRVQLASGKIMLAGGGLGYDSLSSVEIVDPSTGAVIDEAPMTQDRLGASAALLPDGKVLVAGGVAMHGVKDPSVCLASAELFAPIPNGAACDGDAACQSGHCVDGVCCDTSCGGQCEACDVAGHVGSCSFVTGAVHGARKACPGADACTSAVFHRASQCDGAGSCAELPEIACAPYGCTTGGCTTRCDVDEACAPGYVCQASSCVPKPGAHCSDELLSSIGLDGATSFCGAYLCGTDGNCRTSCASSDQCAPGNACDSAAARCVPTLGEGTSAGDPGGCAVQSAGGARGAGLALAFGLAIALGRRARRR